MHDTGHSSIRIINKILIFYSNCLKLI
uniref:Uncharacterized protein n=1 Tax=Anguilla anguilla TaxID=7936 RepID=A0A0E9QEH6_ANGAN